jgi:hypothetical protein
MGGGGERKGGVADLYDRGLMQHQTLKRLIEGGHCMCECVCACMSLRDCMCILVCVLRVEDVYECG